MKKILFLAMLVIAISITAQNVYRGQEFVKGARYQSPNKNFYLIFQDDGNLVLYSKRTNTSVWDSKTSDKGVKAYFQDDGNLVVYNAYNKPVYSTNTSNRGETIRIQDDGNLVIYGSNNRDVWSSIADRAQHGGVSSQNNTVFQRSYRFAAGEKLYSGNRDYYLIFQSDGNLVVYDRNNQVLWDAKTSNRGSRAEFQNDGNLVVYNRKGQPLFATNTSDKNARTLVMQNDGNLVVYDAGNNALWGSDQSK